MAKMSWLGRIPRPGIPLTIMASTLFAMNTVFNSVVFESAGVETPTAVRFLLQGYVALPLLFRKSTNFSCSKFQVMLLVASGIGLGLVTYAGFEAVLFIPPLDATVLFNFQVVFVTIFAGVFLKEPFGIFDIVMALVLIGGVILVSQPEFIFGQVSTKYAYQYIGHLLALLTALLVSICNIISRKLRDCDIIFLLAVQSIFSVCTTFAIGAFNMRPLTSSYELTMVLCGGLSGALARITLFYALAWEDARIVGGVNVFEVVASAILQYFVRGIVPNSLVVIGSAIIISCVCCISLKPLMEEKWRRALKSHQQPLLGKQDEIENCGNA